MQTYVDTYISTDSDRTADIYRYSDHAEWVVDTGPSHSSPCFRTESDARAFAVNYVNGDA